MLKGDEPFAEDMEEREPRMMRTSKIFWLTILWVLTFTELTGAYNPQYLDEVVGRRAVSLGDGCELIMYLLGLEERYPTFESQIEFMKENRLIKKSLIRQASDTPLRRGELAYMLVRTLKLKGGIKARLFGLNGRLAMEELIYQGIMREGHPLDLVTGRELVVIMTRSADHMVTQTKPDGGN